MQTATLISYSLKKQTPLKERERFRRVFFGYKDKSNHGDYEYHRLGVLKAIPYLKPARSLIVIRNSDKKKVISILKKFDVKYLTWKTMLNRRDHQKLNP
jgi:hypothetical protein